MAAKVKSLQSRDCRIGFATTSNQDHRITLAANKAGSSKAEWIRITIEKQLRRQRL